MRGLPFNPAINVILKDACEFQYKKQSPFYALLQEFMKMKLNRTLSILAGLVAGLSLSVPAWAAQVTGGTFQTKIAITADCAMGAGPNTDMDFGSHASTDTSTPNQTTAASFSVTCTNQSPYSIGLQPGNGNLLGAGDMSATVNSVVYKIPYKLYSNSTWTTPWGNTPSGTPNTLSAVGTGAAQVYPVYGKLASSVTSQNLPVGNYTDTVAITVYY